VAGSSIACALFIAGQGQLQRKVTPNRRMHRRTCSRGRESGRCSDWLSHVGKDDAQLALRTKPLRMRGGERRNDGACAGEIAAKAQSFAQQQFRVAIVRIALQQRLAKRSRARRIGAHVAHRLLEHDCVCAHWI
jgi:hypothetical protein